MQLILDVIKNGKNRSLHKSLRFDRKNGVIGRNSDADYQLSDPQNYISGRHVYVEYKYEQYYLRDESTNGTYLKHPYKKLTKGVSHLISASEIYIIGDHELQVRFSDNEYTDDFIVGSFTHEPEPLEAIQELIPDNDFLYEEQENSYKNFQEDKIDQEDVLDLLSGQNKASIILDMNTSALLESDEIGHDFYEQHIDVPNSRNYESEKRLYIPEQDQQLRDSFRILEEKLGLEIVALEKKERDLLLIEIAETLINSLDGLKNSLFIKDQTKKDIYLSGLSINSDENNPLKEENNALGLLQQSSSGFKLSVAVARSFAQIDLHTISLHGASKNLINTSLAQFSPQNLEYKFDAMGELRGPIPRSCLMWKAYCKMFDQLSHNPQFSAEILAPYFTKEYEKLAYSMGLMSFDTLQK